MYCNTAYLEKQREIELWIYLDAGLDIVERMLILEINDMYIIQSMIKSSISMKTNTTIDFSAFVMGY